MRAARVFAFGKKKQRGKSSLTVILTAELLGPEMPEDCLIPPSLYAKWFAHY